MASKPATNGLSSSRPPFRRQGSSVAGGHPMAVALPVHKVDYSVTKGGARTWAVLLVFMFLCSSLYTVFSAKEIAEIAVDMDGDGAVDLDEDVSDNIDEVAAQQRHRARSQTPSEEEHGHGADRKSEQHRHTSIETADDDEDEDAEEHTLETQLFAGLRKKIESNMRKAKEMLKFKTSGNEEEEPKPKRQRRAKKQKDEKKEEKEEEVEEKEEEEEKPQERRKRKERRRKEPEPQEEEEVEEEKEEEPEEVEEKEEKVAEKSEAPVPEEEEEEEEEQQTLRPDKKPRRRRLSRITEDAPIRPCKRKNCPPAYAAQPRKELLKKKRGDSTSSKRYHVLSADELDLLEDDYDEDEEEEEKEEEELAPPPEPVQELVAIKKFRASGREAYKRHAITSREDHRHRTQLDQADFLTEKHDYGDALSLFDAILRQSPRSPRAHFGKARVYDIRGEYEASEKDLDAAIHEYEVVLDNEDTPDALFRQAAARLIDRARFRGQMHRSIRAQRALIDRFPEEITLQNELGLIFLQMKRYDDAKKIFKDVLEVSPSNGIAHAYYGYILKIVDNDVENGVAHMRRGLRAADGAINDAKFFYHLGHGLVQLGRNVDAYHVYEEAAAQGLFLSAEQRSMYNMDGLTGRPWWSLEQTGYSKHLKAIERQWVSIRYEALEVFREEPELWLDVNPTLTVDGEWKEFAIFKDGAFVAKHCRMIPLTCAILEDFYSNSNASRSEMSLSVLTSGAHVLPHCGPSNTRLQAQMGLVVPSEARIRVGHDQRGWKAGKFILFDDSFEHEVHFDGASLSSFRLVLVIDLWHPEVDPRLRTAEKKEF